MRRKIIMLNTKGKKEFNLDVIETQIRILLEEIGENPEREGLLKTPHRVAKAYEFLTKGYRQDVKSVINGAIFEEKYDEMVIVKDVDFFLVCVTSCGFIISGLLYELEKNCWFSKLRVYGSSICKKIRVQERMSRK